MEKSNNNNNNNNNNKKTSIFLNVYDLTTLNNYFYWFGIGIFHSAVEVHGVEFAFGAHEYATTGVFEIEPRQCPGFIFRRTVELGTTDLSPEKVREAIEKISDEYKGNSYHLIAKNCNHFSNDLSLRLTGKGIPGWVNRLAGMGAFCNCLLPESLQVDAVCHTLEYYPHEGSAHTCNDEDERLLQADDFGEHPHVRDWINDNNQGHRIIMSTDAYEAFLSLDRNESFSSEVDSSTNLNGNSEQHNEDNKEVQSLLRASQSE